MPFQDSSSPLRLSPYSDGNPIESYFHKLATAMNAVPMAAVMHVTNALISTFEAGRTVLFFGNGGSAAAAAHVVCDLNKGASSSQWRLKAISLADNIPLITAWANDAGYEYIFSEQLRNFAQPGDIAFAISCSGNSINVLRALEAGREAGAITIGLTGFDGGKLKEACDICIVVPSETMQIIEDVHSSILHAISTAVREYVYSKQGATFAAANS